LAAVQLGAALRALRPGRAPWSKKPSRSVGGKRVPASVVQPFPSRDG
jgi:hypothetical protein